MLILNPAAMLTVERLRQWRGQLMPKSGKKGKPVVYTSYGEGKKPKLLGSVPLNKPTDWISEGDHLWSTCSDEVHVGAAVADFAELTWGLHQEGGAKVERKVDVPPSEFIAKNQYNLLCSAPDSASNHIQFIVAGFPVQAKKSYQLRFAAKSTKPFAITFVSFSKPGSSWAGLGSAARLPVEIGTEWAEREILFHCKKDHEKARFTLSLGNDLPQDAEFSFVPLELRKATVESNGIHTDIGNMILDGNKAGFKKWMREDLKTQDDFWYEGKTDRVFFFSDKNPVSLYKFETS